MNGYLNGDQFLNLNNIEIKVACYHCYGKYLEIVNKKVPCKSPPVHNDL